MEHIETPHGFALRNASLAHNVMVGENDDGSSDGILLHDSGLIVLRVNPQSGNWLSLPALVAQRSWHCARNQSGTCVRDKLV